MKFQGDSTLDEMVDIEIQSKFGGWKRYCTVPNTDAGIRLALQAASGHPFAALSNKTRAVTQKSNREVAVLCW